MKIFISFRATKEGRRAEGHRRNGCILDFLISQTQRKRRGGGAGLQGALPSTNSAPRFLSRGTKLQVTVLILKIFLRGNKKTKTAKMDKKSTTNGTWRLSFVRKKKRQQTNTSINYRLLSFTGGTFLCFHLLPIVKAVVNIFILSFCVLKLSCKGSCYINV